MKLSAIYLNIYYFVDLSLKSIFYEYQVIIKKTHCNLLFLSLKSISYESQVTITKKTVICCF